MFVWLWALLLSLTVYLLVRRDFLLLGLCSRVAAMQTFTRSAVEKILGWTLWFLWGLSYGCDFERSATCVGVAVGWLSTKVCSRCRMTLSCHGIRVSNECMPSMQHVCPRTLTSFNHCIGALTQMWTISRLPSSCNRPNHLVRCHASKLCPRLFRS